MMQLFGFVRVIGLFLFVFLWTKPFTARGEENTNSICATLSLFDYGRYEASFNNGALFSPFLPAKNRPTVDYSLTEIQCGYMLSDAKWPGILHGNFEFVGEGFGSAVFDGPGSFIAGITLWLRYNFLQPDCRLVPYLQAGAGLLATDIDRNLVGQPFNFNLDIGFGARYFVAKNWAVNVEYRYQHISNANTGRNNLGINAHGPMLGVSCFF